MKKAALLAALAVLSFSFVAAQDRGAVEITGSGVNGRVLHRDVIRQNARPGDYITVFSGIKLDTPRHLTRGDIDYSKDHYTEDIQVSLDTPPPASPQTIWGANLMIEFSADSVTAAFNAIHEFLQTCNGKPDRVGLIRSRIALGDYLDLPALTVKRNFGGGDFSAVNTSLVAGRPLLRLIVVGVDSFTKTNSGAPAHVVFQFQNIPIERRMNWTDTNKGGYAKSEMRRI
ncbi:hypothetical protein FACS1894130_11960 [Spirochaetia bacterium]|nr:hypothetical protein FACS1894130_11960 [Spirochaetia bacterium]